MLAEEVAGAAPLLDTPRRVIDRDTLIRAVKLCGTTNTDQRYPFCAFYFGTATSGDGIVLCAKSHEESFPSTYTKMGIASMGIDSCGIARVVIFLPLERA